MVGVVLKAKTASKAKAKNLFIIIFLCKDLFVIGKGRLIQLIIL
jgi:hypothetical protein